MKKQFISILITFLIFSTHFSKKLSMFAESSAIISADFEDGDISMFSKRGEYDASVLELKKDGGNSGSNYLWVSDRKETWNGAQFGLEGKCTEGAQYIVSLAVKANKASTVCLSMQHTDSSGEDHYNNIMCTESQGKWVKMNEKKFTVPTGGKNVFLYIENISGTDDFGVDDLK